VRVPEVRLPKVAPPKVELPKVKVPKVEVPQVHVPKVDDVTKGVKDAIPHPPPLPGLSHQPQVGGQPPTGKGDALRLFDYLFAP
jgi:hypothetical protein